MKGGLPNVSLCFGRVRTSGCVCTLGNEKDVIKCVCVGGGGGGGEGGIHTSGCVCTHRNEKDVNCYQMSVWGGGGGGYILAAVCACMGMKRLLSNVHLCVCVCGGGGGENTYKKEELTV